MKMRTELNLEGVASGSVTDHGTLLGLADDDHAQYVHLSAARTITGQHSFSPGSTQAPFLLGANAQSQLVTGLRADELSKSVNVSGLGLSGGGALIADRTVTLTSSSAPGGSASILASDSNGYLQLERLGLGTSSPSAPLHVRSGVTVQARIEYDGSNHLRFQVGSDGTTVLDVTGTAGSLRLQPGGDITLNPGGNDVLPLTNDVVNLGAINRKYLTLWVSELWAETLVAAEVLSTIGGQILVAPTTTLQVDLDSTILLANADFESRTGNDFDNWTETAGSGSIVAETTDVHKGSSAVKITTGSTDNTYIESDAITVTADTGYVLNVWNHVNMGDSAGRLSIWDDSNSAWIIQNRNLSTSETYWQSDASFVTPTACTAIKIRLAASATNTDVTFFDNAWLNFDEIVLEHNQPDDNDTLVMKSLLKLEYLQTNQFSINVADTGSDYFEVLSNYGDVTAKFPTDKLFQVRGSTGNDGEYTVSSSTFTGGKTRIFVTAVPSSTGDGYVAYTMDDMAGPYTYHRCNRNIDRTGANEWFIGDALANTGFIGDGFIDLYSVNGLQSGAGPTIAGSVRGSASYDDIEERWAIGNLNGLYGYAADEYGFAAGDPNGPRVTIEDTNGIRFYGNNVQRGSIDLSGNFWYGDSATTERLSWDSTNGLQIYNASNTAVLKVPTSGDVDIIGTLDVVSPGKVTAGDGDVVLDSNGLTLLVSTTGHEAAKSIEFETTGGADRFYIYNQEASSFNLVTMHAHAVTSKYTHLAISASGGSGESSTIELTAYNYGQNSSTLTIYATNTVNYVKAGETAQYVQFFINDEANAKNLQGLTINQHSLDDEIFSLKSSDIAHGMTTETETDTYGVLKKVNATTGSLAVKGYGEANFGLILYGLAGTGTTATSSTAQAPIACQSFKKSGTSSAAVGSTENAFIVRNQFTTRFIIKGDGEIHTDYNGPGTGETMVVYDKEDDIGLLRAFDLKSGGLDLADSWFQKNISRLRDLGIVSSPPEDDSLFVSNQKMTKLLIGAIWQMYQKIEALDKRGRND